MFNPNPNFKYQSGYAKQHEFGHNCSVAKNPNAKTLAVFKSKHNKLKITFCYECWFTWIETWIEELDEPPKVLP